MIVHWGIAGMGAMEAMTVKPKTLPRAVELELLLVQQFRDEVTRILELRQMSRGEFARRMGVSRGYVEQLKRAPNVTLATVARVAAALEAEAEVRILIRRPNRSQGSAAAAAAGGGEWEESPI